MPRYRYVTRSLEGRIRRGEVAAGSPEEAAARLQEAGVYVTKLVPLRLTKREGNPGRVFASGSDQLFLLESWAVFLEAGLPMQSVLLRLSLRCHSISLSRAIDSLQQAIDEGVPFIQALRTSRIFPPSWVAVLSVGEQNGNYVTPMRMLRRYLEESQRFKREIVTMMIMPGILLTLIAIWFWLFFARVIPSFALLVSQTGSAPPKLMVWVVSVSHGIRAVFPWVFLAVCGMFAVNLFARRADREMGILQSWIPIGTPIIGPLIAKIQLIIIASALHLQLEAGIPLVSALETLRYGVTNRAVRRDLIEAHRKLLEGVPVPEAMSEIRVIPSDGQALIAAGDASGKIPQMMEMVARQTQSVLIEEVKRLVIFIHSFVILAAGILVGLLLIVFFSILFQSLGSFSGSSAPTQQLHMVD